MVNPGLSDQDAGDNAEGGDGGCSQENSEPGVCDREAAEGLEVYKEEVTDLIKDNILEEGNLEGAEGCGIGEELYQNRGFWTGTRGLVSSKENKAGNIKKQRDEDLLGGLEVGSSCSCQGQ